VHLLIENIPWAILFAFIFAVVAAVIFKIAAKPSKRKLIIFIIASFLAALYVCIACSVLFSVTKFGIYGDVEPYSGNYIPFKTIMEFAGSGSFGLFVTQIAGNILVIIPLPFVVWLYSRKRAMKRVCLVSLIITTAIEPMQLLLNILIGGPTNIIDIDDLILNLVGCALGLLLLKVVIQTAGRIKQIK